MTFHAVALNGLHVMPVVYGYDGASIGALPPANGDTFLRERLPSEALGASALTLTNVVVGSAIRIEVQSTGTLVESRTADATTEEFTVPYYQVSNANNDLRIKVRKASGAPKYQPFETLAVAAAGSQSVYIAQVPDPIA